MRSHCGLRLAGTILCLSSYLACNGRVTDDNGKSNSSGAPANLAGGGAAALGVGGTKTMNGGSAGFREAAADGGSALAGGGAVASAASGGAMTGMSDGGAALGGFGGDAGEGGADGAGCGAVVSQLDASTGITFRWTQCGVGAPVSVKVESDCARFKEYLSVGPGAHTLCIDATLEASIVGPVEVYFPRGGISPTVQPQVIRCTAPMPIGCPANETRSGEMCCQALPVNGVGDPVLALASTLGWLVYTDSAKDTDSDFFPDLVDNCPLIPNAFGQEADLDHDGVGDACDNCPAVPNSDQADSNHDGIGDSCEGLAAAAGAGGNQ